MATVRLYRNGRDEITDLPFVCMECGADATRTRSTSYMDTIWRRQRIAKPLCEKHWRYVRFRKVFRFGGSGAYFAFVFAQNAMGRFLTPANFHILAWWPPAGMLVLSVIAMVSWYVLKSRIRVEKITETVIELTGVAPQFVAALEYEAEANRDQFASEIGLHFGSSAAGEDRILPSGDNNLQTTP